MALSVSSARVTLNANPVACASQRASIAPVSCAALSVITFVSERTMKKPSPAFRLTGCGRTEMLVTWDQQQSGRLST